MDPRLRKAGRYCGSGLSEQVVEQVVFFGGAEPCGFGGEHGLALFGGIVFGTGEMVETVGDVEGEFVVGALAGGAFLNGAIDIDHQIAAPCLGFAGDRIIAEADDIGGAVFSEIFPVGLGDAIVIDEYDADLAPCIWCGPGFEFIAEPFSEPLNFFQLHRMACLPV